MRFEAEEEQLVVVSDLHLGSPASRAAQAFPGFVDGLRGTGWQLCINGDAFDLLQGTKRRLAVESLDAIRALQRFRRSGGRVYYVLGNHDLLLEHLLGDLSITVAPFLNLRSGDARIRIEHGHVYEPTYVRWPRLYHAGAVAGRYALAASGDVYGLYARCQRALDARRRRSEETYPFYVAASQLFARGFDATVFGHNHVAELTHRDGGTVANCGSWMRRPSHVRIDNGDLTLLA